MNWIQRFLAAITTHQAELDAHTRNIYSVLRTGEYFTPFPVYGSTVSHGVWTDRLTAFPFPVPRDLTIDRLAVQVTTTVAGGLARLGIYNNTGNLIPGSLLLDAGEVDASTLGVKTIVVDQALAKGLYWLALATNNNAYGLRELSNLFVPIGIDETAFGKIRPVWFSAFVYAALPDPFPAVSTFSSSSAAFQLVFARLKSLD
ncbi:unnamed protein product [marine sediment metagenome]|uniref:Uncharacterized protein n=1 Tax=marine sediment metagenome TaxID=412755 RepID=X1TJH8_9ZZZZ